MGCLLFTWTPGRTCCRYSAILQSPSPSRDYRRLAREGSLFGGFVPPMLQEECTLSTPQVLRPYCSVCFKSGQHSLRILSLDAVQDQVSPHGVAHCSSWFDALLLMDHRWS